MIRRRRREDPVPQEHHDLTHVTPGTVGTPATGGGSALVARAGRSNRTVWVMAIIAVLCLALGLLAGRLVKSPAQIAAESAPPEAGPITIAVERQELSSDVVVRGDALYDGAVSVTVETADLGGPAVVTGAVPQVGDTVEPGSVLLEVTGRPVIALPGELPVYRSLRAGVSGPDVTQLQEALGSLDLDAGNSGTYDAATAAAVAELFTRAGYPAPEADEAARDELAMAQESVTAAEQSLAAAESDLRQAQSGPADSERLSLQGAVNSAQRDLDEARACWAAPAEQSTDPETGQTLTLERSCPRVADLEDAVRIAVAARDEALAAPDVSAQQEMRDAAATALAEARSALEEARLGVLTPLPAGEVAYLADLPRRVDEVAVSRGSAVSGEVLRVSGVTLQIVASVSESDFDLIQEGATATLSTGDLELPATVVQLSRDGSGILPQESGSGSDSGDGFEEFDDGFGGGSSVPTGPTVVLHPDDLTEDQRSQLAGSNVRVTIPVSSTAGEVLTVPVAALTAGPGGESRIEVMRDGAQAPELVEVTTGLAADGYVEVASSVSPLQEGDLVVVGVGGSGDDGDSSQEDDGVQDADGSGR
ncbi:hypothetical protein [Serinibacter salmoneus]|uniref:Peptidoglycan binding protein n=1 Tax=Serinibacter salmoneus TaxID=556530 RepID=A0A2A9CY41_9MICO|nr:hypothetical protein [Serinibacter salmoneus]PFG19056.1 hypothetical protein ATL40_0610 [Serinibacter salmoneus]